MFLKRFRPFRPAAARFQTDSEFVAAYRETGNLDVLGALYERHMELVYAVCFKYLRDEEESRDAVMQLFEQLVTDLKRFEVTNFKSWLHSVARNYCLMQLRSRRLSATAGSEGDLSGNEEPFLQPGADLLITDDDSFEWEENLERMNRCLQTLPEEQRRCLDLFYLQEKSYADVAQQTGFSLKQVKSYLQNGRRNLKNCMDKWTTD